MRAGEVGKTGEERRMRRWMVCMVCMVDSGVNASDDEDLRLPSMDRSLARATRPKCP